MWTKSACVMAACSILLILAAAGMIRSALPAQAVTRTPRTSSISTAISSSTTSSSPAGRIRVTLTTAARLVAAPRPAGRYAVQPGNTLSGIAAALAVPGGWPALYAANKTAIGPNPGLIRAGTILRVPGAAPARYTVGTGDTLSGIASALAVPGGWPALYAANKTAIGPNPGLIRAGIVLAIPPPATPARPRTRPGRARQPASRPKAHPGPSGTPRPRLPPAAAASPARAPASIARFPAPGHAPQPACPAG
jgi:LysM repeat protein